MSTLVGSQLGRYRLEHLLGRGGMAEVYAATDEVLGRRVAVKVIRPQFAEEPQFVERFLQEARLVARLDHPSILAVYDFGEADGRPYLVMPLLAGGTLAERTQGRPQPPAAVARWLGELAAALDAAHGTGVLHRDIKPGNVLVAQDGRLVLADFGIARLAEVTTRLTATGVVVGTPTYMAPEVAKGEGASPASDRYALAVMTWELLAGRPPFQGENPLSVLHQQITEPVPSLRQTAGVAVPSALDGFFARALAKDPRQRPTSAGEMADALQRVVGADTRAETPAAGFAAHADAPGVDAGDTEPTRLLPRQRRSSWYRWAAAALVLAFGLGLLALWRARQPHSPQRSVETATAGLAREAGPGLPAPTGAPSRAAEPPVKEGGPPSSTPAAPSDAPSATPASAPPSTAVGATAPAAASDHPVAGAADPAALAAAAGAPAAWPSPPRRLDHRATRADFVAWIDWSRRAAAAGVEAPAVEAARTWGEGGLAYLTGDLGAAERARLELAHRRSGLVPWSLVWPAVVFAGEPAALARALTFGDARGEAAAALPDPRVVPRLRRFAREPGARKEVRSTELRPADRLAHLYLAHLEGRHGEGIAMLERTLDQHAEVRRLEGSDVLGLAAQLGAAEALEAARETTFRQAFEHALRLGGPDAPLTAAFVLEMAREAEARHAGDGSRVLADACALQVSQACASAGLFAGR